MICNQRVSSIFFFRLSLILGSPFRVPQSIVLYWEGYRLSTRSPYFDATDSWAARGQLQVAQDTGFFVFISELQKRVDANAETAEF